MFFKLTGLGMRYSLETLGILPQVLCIYIHILMRMFCFLFQLWALLHFIMPTLFDSHEEFNDWFSKDIESHVEKQSGINEGQSKILCLIIIP